MDIVGIVLAVVAAIMILVFVHELGHFLAARLFGMRVDRFSVGFPPKIASRKIGETEYVLGATPLGGYVKIAGMIDESMDSKFVDAEPQPWEYRSKPLWQRAIVIAAGVAFNFILAAAIFAGLKMVYGDSGYLAQQDGYVYVADSSLAAERIGLRTGDRIVAISGVPFDPDDVGGSVIPLLADTLVFEVDRHGQTLALPGPGDIMTQIQNSSDGGIFGLGLFNEPSVVGDIVPDMPADTAGLMPGDRIAAINGWPVTFWMEMTSFIRDSDGRTLALEVVRMEDGGARTLHKTILPSLEADGEYRIGVGIARRTVDYAPIEAVRRGLADTWDNTRAIAINLRRIVTGKEDVRENLGGPVMVAKITGQAAQQGGQSFWRIVALLSITLAIVNILPIPVLDGGHLVFLLYEAVARREPSVRFRMITQQVGFGILLLLMAFLVYNDITRL